MAAVVTNWAILLLVIGAYLSFVGIVAGLIIWSLEPELSQTIKRWAEDFVERHSK